MPLILSRRNLLIGASLAPLASRPLFAAEGGVQDRLREIETSVGGRLGIAALDMESDRRVDYRSANLFPICSTFKLLLAGAVLSKVDIEYTAPVPPTSSGIAPAPEPVPAVAGLGFESGGKTPK